MSDPFFSFFDKDRSEIDPESSEWSRISYKIYPRSQRIILPRPSLLEKISLNKALEYRKTERNFSQVPISLEAISSLLFWSVGLVNKKNDQQKEFRRFYPSGGARFPIEIYMANFKGGELNPGVYHYNVREHSLERLLFASAEKMKHALTFDFAKEAATLLLFSFVSERANRKYGNLGYKLGLIEAGHIGQNVYLVCAALGLGVCALGGMNYEIVQKELGFGEEETVFYQLAVGETKGSR